MTEANREISSILIFDDSTAETRGAAESVGASFVTTPEALAKSRCDLVIAPIKNLSQLKHSSRLFESGDRRLIVVGQQDEAHADAVFDLLHETPIFAWISSYSAEDFTSSVMQALDQARENRQATESLAMYFEHNQTLQKLSEELEQRIELRRSELNDSTWRLQQSQRRSEIMHRTLNAVHVSQSIPEIERQLLQVLGGQGAGGQTHSPQDAPTVDWIRITFAAQSRLEAAPVDARAGSIFSAAIGSDSHIHFGRSAERPFRSDDRNFLTSIAEAVALAVTRLRSLERMERIKHEWEETFNAITHPIAVLDENLRLVRGNRALLKGRAPEQVVGRPCYEAVFGRQQACPACPVMGDFLAGRFRHRSRSTTVGLNRTNQFRIAAPSGHAEVSSRPLHHPDEAMLVHLYRDATSSVQFEKRIVESSKMAELGTIGSSIAHQLNNPIGGMLSHIQLLLMDLKTLNFDGRDELVQEMREMENGTRRCAEIVRDLLGFSRRADEDEAHDHDLLEIVTQAMKITELQTRSRGIRFKMTTKAGSTGASEVLISGRFNLLAQAVRAVLLTLLPKGLRDLTVPVTVHILNDATNPKVEVEIGPVPGAEIDQAASGGLDLTVARQILSEHGGSLTGPASNPASDSVNPESKFPAQRAILSLPIKSWAPLPD